MTQKIMSRLPGVARYLLGGLLAFSGLGGLLGLATPPPMPEGALAFVGALAATGYMLPLIKGTEVVVGLLLLSGRLVPLALTVLAPVVVNIAAFHAVLAPDGLGVGLVLVGLTAYLAWQHRAAYRGLLVVASERAADAAERGVRGGVASSPAVHA